MNVYLFAVVVILWYMLYRYRRRRVYELAALIPTAPEKIPYVGALQHSYNIMNNIIDLIHKYTDFAQNNGGFVKIWVGPMLYVGITNPEDVEFILKNCLEKADIVKLIRSIVGNAGIFAPVSIWTRRRKLLIPAFSPKIINSFMNILINQSEELAKQLSRHKKVGTGRFEAWSFISAYTLGSVCETALGIRINYVQNPDNKFLKAATNLFALMADRIFQVWLWPDVIYNCSSKSTEFYENLKTVYDLTDEIIQTKKEELKDEDIQLDSDSVIFGQSPKKVRCFLEHLILLSKNSGGFTDVELREEVITFLLAGTDTSSVAICNTLTLLAKYPKEQEKVYQEIVEVLGELDRPLEKDDLKEFKYLERVIKESLRLFPPAPLLIRKVTEETSMPTGVTLPADTGIIVSVWGISRDKKHWGPDADCFNPDRFLPDRKTGLFIPFSSGPRNCVGYQYALLSVKMALVGVLRRYKVVGQEEEGPAPKIDTKFTIMMKAKDNYQIALEAR
ncbi:cytochrome P450 4C1-like isoform X1 [Colias croceus]|uniref:cytochrome P450 4C1-like isoform X1 n=1 Tax=Colias crocea TaxID=72248 RepID=UPI001E27A944|nr:cytochrome P450 4C1-like isoform X1 [Colias croceus]